MMIYSELARFLNLNDAEIISLYEKCHSGIIDEWANSNNEYDFYGNTYYYLFDLLNWENKDKSDYFDTYREYMINNPSIKTVLDYGCGIGSDSLFLAENFDVNIILCDVPSKHLDFAIWRFKDRGLKEPAVICIGSDMPKLISNDLTMCVAVLEHIRNPKNVLSNILANTSNIALRVDPTMNGNPMHFESNFDFLRELDGADEGVLKKYGLERNNHKDPPIFRVVDNKGDGI